MQKNIRLIKNDTSINQVLIRKSKILIKEKILEKNIYSHVINFFLKKKKLYKKNIISKEYLPIAFGFLNDYGKINPRTKKYNISMNKYKSITKLIKNAREFKVIPYTYKVICYT